MGVLGFFLMAVGIAIGRTMLTNSNAKDSTIMMTVGSFLIAGIGCFVAQAFME